VVEDEERGKKNHVTTSILFLKKFSSGGSGEGPDEEGILKGKEGFPSSYKNKTTKPPHKHTSGIVFFRQDYLG